MGRPRKEIAYDAEAIKDFIAGEYQYLLDKKTLQTEHKEMRDAFKERIDAKLVTQIIRAVKLGYQMEHQDASPDTIEEIRQLVDEQFGALFSQEAAGED